MSSAPYFVVTDLSEASPGSGSPRRVPGSDVGLRVGDAAVSSAASPRRSRGQLLGYLCAKGIVGTDHSDGAIVGAEEGLEWGEGERVGTDGGALPFRLSRVGLANRGLTPRAGSTSRACLSPKT